MIIIDLIKEYLTIVQKTLISLLPWAIPAIWSEGDKGDVILIPPFGTNWKFIKNLGEIFHSWGYRVHVISRLDNNIYPIEQAARYVDEYVRERNLKNIILVSHSKGGVIAKYFMDFFPLGERVIKSISVASPYRGTLWAYLWVFNLYEGRPGSSLIKKLNSETKNNHKIVAIFPKIDNHVIPNKNLRLEGATNIQLDIVGHTRILDAKELKEELRKIL